MSVSHTTFAYNNQTQSTPLSNRYTHSIPTSSPSNNLSTSSILFTISLWNSNGLQESTVEDLFGVYH